MTSGFASTSLVRHLLRGGLGFGLLIGAFALIPAVGPAALLLVVPALVALRGCPTCWIVGLIQTISMGRLRRSCTDGQCRITTSAPERAGGQWSGEKISRTSRRA